MSTFRKGDRVFLRSNPIPEGQVIAPSARKPYVLVTWGYSNQAIVVKSFTKVHETVVFSNSGFIHTRHHPDNLILVKP